MVPCPYRALFERTRNLAGAQAAEASRCAEVVFRRLHPHQNPGTGDLPGKDRSPPSTGTVSAALGPAALPRLLCALMHQNVVFRAQQGQILHDRRPALAVRGPVMGV